MLIAYLYARVILLILLRHLEVSLNERTKTPDTAKNFMFSLILPSLFLSKIYFLLNFLSYFFLIWLNRISVYFCGVLAHSFFFLYYGPYRVIHQIKKKSYAIITSISSRFHCPIIFSWFHIAALIITIRLRKPLWFG